MNAVILGCKPGRLYLNRISKAISLEPAQFVLCGTDDEQAFAVSEFINRGFGIKRVLGTKASCSTMANLRMARESIPAGGSIVIVTDWVHAFRVRYLIKKLRLHWYVEVCKAHNKLNALWRHIKSEVIRNVRARSNLYL